MMLSLPQQPPASLSRPRLARQPGARPRLQASLSRSSCPSLRRVRAQAARGRPAAPPPDDTSSRLVFGASWTALVAYAALLAPNQTPLRDSYFLEKVLGLGIDNVPLNDVFFSLFMVMGVWPAVYASLLIPSAKSGNGVPAWPFVTASFAAGAFALLPFFALWTPPAEPAAPPSPRELEEGGLRTVIPRVLESRLLAGFLLAVATGLGAKALLSGGPGWYEFGRLFRESRLVHVTSVDFMTLSLCAPLWVLNDARARSWDPPALLPLALTPLFGPLLYLNLRSWRAADESDV